MKKDERTKVLYLTQHILEEYWQGDLTPLLEHLHEKILWIGSMDEEYICGAKNMVKRLSENQEAMPPVFLDQQEYGIVQNAGHTCVVAGRYRAYTKPESGMLLSEKQRVTFVWERVVTDEKDEMLIRHIHLSNILHIQSEDERFPTRAGKENYEYVQRILAERSQDKVISVKDREGTNRVLNYSDIMYLKASGNYIEVFLANNEDSFFIRGRLSVMLEGLPEGFIKVSRSLGINRSYVQSIHSRHLVMIDGAEFRVPVATCVEVQRAIKREDV